MNNDTIIAQATAIGLSGIGIIRISGKLVKFIALKLLCKLPKPRYATYTKFKNLKGETLDLGIAIFFNKPNSYTGEDVLELHTHGNQIIIEIIIKEIINLSNNIRYAKAGEFTKRAWLNNRIDLIQAESINDIIHANSELSVKYTLNNLTGKFSLFLNNYFKKLIQIKKYVENCLSFENYESSNNKIIKEFIIYPLKELITNFNYLISNIKKTLHINKGLKVIITGQPNVGKSSIFNAILGYERAIVTNLKGTTRDIISEFIYLNKIIPIYLIDTAGIRNNVINKVEKKGIELTIKELKEANCIIYIMDYKIHNTNLNIKINNVISGFNNKIPLIFVINKIDKAKIGLTPKIVFKNIYPCIFLSNKHKKGIYLLKNLLFYELKQRYILDTQHKHQFYATERHITYLSKINKHLKNVLYLITEHKFAINDICAEELYIAEQCFEELFGKKIDNNILLNEIFNTFCIGK